MRAEAKTLKTIGLIGGMSWESTMTYYQIINTTVKEMLGGLHSGKILLNSVDFYEIEKHQSKGEWDICATMMIDAARSLEAAGADFIVICTNTMHKVVPQIQENIAIPILHIADAVSQELKQHGITKAALLGTKYTLTETFYIEKLVKAGIEILIPEPQDIEIINRVIFEELCLGIVSPDSKKEYLRIIGQLETQGAQSVILGCTEIGLMIKQEDTSLPVFDTARIHAEKAARSGCTS
ncbi:racemase [Lacrimispora xylanolytica]